MSPPTGKKEYFVDGDPSPHSRQNAEYPMSFQVFHIFRAL